MNILITGCNGQLGSEMQRLAPRHPGHSYIFSDVAELDITDAGAVDAFVAQHRIDCTVNCAAYTAVDKAEEDEARCQLINGDAPGYLARAMAANGGSIIHVSTDYVFDGTGHVPYVEEQAACPATAYGRTKLSGEKNVLENCPGAMVIRTGWLYSTFGNNFVKTMLRLGSERTDLGVIFDQVGTPTYARDLAVAIFAAIEKGIVPGIYHFSNEGVASWFDFTKAIHRLAGITTCHVRPLHTDEYPTPAVRPHYSVLDKTKIKRTYSIEIPYWEDSLAECVADLLQA